MSACRNLPERLSIDSSVLLAYLLGEDLADLIEECILFSRREVYVARIVLAETYYVVCRLSGRDVARDLLVSLRESGVMEVVGDDSLDVRAGDIKCTRSISIADCYVIALAELVRGTAVFAKRERELKQELEREPFGVDIVFLDDYLKRQPHG